MRFRHATFRSGFSAFAGHFHQATSIYLSHFCQSLADSREVYHGDVLSE